MGNQWRGIKRALSGLNIETCYDVYADMSNASASAYLRVNGFCIYAGTKDAISSKLPFTVKIQVGSGTAYTFKTSDQLSTNGYTANNNWMAYYVRYVATDNASNNIAIPTDGSATTIRVTVTPKSGSAISFTENICGVYPISITVPTYMVTGKIYNCTCSRAVKFGTNYQTTCVIKWKPNTFNIVDATSTSTLTFDSYLSEYVKLTAAGAAFSKFQFAINNRYEQPNVTESRSNATVEFKTVYKTSDFTGGIIISSQTSTTQIRPRPEVDSALLPVLDTAKTTYSTNPASAKINNKVVADVCSVILKPSIKYKYAWSGDIHRAVFWSSYSLASHVANTCIPMKNGSITISRLYYSTSYIFIHDQWKYGKSGVYNFEKHGTEITYNIPLMGYAPPRIWKFDIRRAVVDSNGRYSYGGTKYSEDDNGGYCIIEYGVDYRSLENSNTKKLTIKYGGASKAITINSAANSYGTVSQQGYIVVPANTERVLEISITVSDKFTSSITQTLTLSTAGVLMDFLNGGDGIAIGKVADKAETLDINPNWRLYFYRATIQDVEEIGRYYYGRVDTNGDMSLTEWMKDIEKAIESVRNSYTYYSG